MSALIVPVSLPPEIERFRLAHVPTAGSVMPHVTLIYPFVPIEQIDDRVRASLGEIARGRACIDFHLGPIRRWPTATYLAVEPAAPFERLVADLVRAFPEYPPYEGKYEFVPHVSLAEDEPDVDVTSIESDLARLEAGAARAREMLLIWRDGERWVAGERYPFVTQPES